MVFVIIYEVAEVSMTVAEYDQGVVKRLGFFCMIVKILLITAYSAPCLSRCVMQGFQLPYLQHN